MVVATAATVAALLLPACDACSPQGWWWTNPDGTVVDDTGNGVASEGEGDVAAEGEGAEGEGAASEGEGAASEGEGEGVAGEGEGEGGIADGTVWLQLDYSSASSPSSPSFTFSQTPFTGSSWAADGASYPEAWDRFNNMTVDDDPIGRSLTLGGQLQLMIGLHGVTSYQGVTVRLEGRAAETSSSVFFDVYNPLNNCGVTGVEMSNDWTVHTVDVDLGNCLVPGDGVQAVRVAPSSGTMALVRMKVILQGAAF